MIERLIHTLLRAGITEMQEKPQLLEGFFRRVKRLDDAEIVAIRAFFEKTPPNIVHSYARENDPLPLWSVVLLDEQEVEHFLGDEGDDITEEMVDGELFDPEDVGAEQAVSIYKSSYGILTYADHPDITRYYYELSKFAISRGRKFLRREGQALEITISGGELAPDPRYIPAHLFVRQLMLTVQTPERVVGSHPARAFTIGGIHVADPSVSETALGGVTANVTTVEVGE